ncbi:MAG: spermidine/putrescine transport system substrate-binding protein [Thermoleophilaceae bacterium]|nr:spermidine/putrescine transport system substrate-binding protein [Thermoleophilaceae bacterium]
MRAHLLALVLIAATVAAGCGDDLSDDDDGARSTVPKGEAKGEFTFSQWPLYIDPGKNGTVAEFERDSGIKVKYVEEINDNVEFFAKLRPLLERGETGGRSLITVSDWLAARLYDRGYLYKLDYSQLPNVEKNLIPALREPAADPKREFTVPWQSGMTGLIVRTDMAPGVDEVADLFDPKYKGKVTMLTELRDTVPMTLKSMGIDPDEASTEEWLEAVAKVEEAGKSGQIRRFTGNDYIRDLTKGDAWISLGWSGDAVQLQKTNPAIRFVMPKEGCMLWSTSLEIPVGAPNPQAAQAFINYVYDPEVQADIAEYVNYVTPVSGVKEILRKRDPKLAESQLVFPSEEFTADCTFEPVLGGEQGAEVTEAFQRAIGN